MCMYLFVQKIRKKRPASPRPAPPRPLPSRHVVPLAAVRGVREKGHAGPQGRVHVWSARIRTPAFGLRSLAGRSALAMLSDGEPKNKRPRRFLHRRNPGRRKTDLCRGLL